MNGAASVFVAALSSFVCAENLTLTSPAAFPQLASDSGSYRIKCDVVVNGSGGTDNITVYAYDNK